MKFIALFIFMLDCIWGNITQKMINEVNKEVWEGNGLMLSFLDPYIAYIYSDSILSRLGKSRYDETAILKKFFDKLFDKDSPPGILSATLNTFFSLSWDGTITHDVLQFSIAKRFFLDNESRSNGIKIFSTFFLNLLKKDKSIKLTHNFIDKQNSITDPELLYILNNDIKKDKISLVFSLVTLNAFMLEVLDTKEELKEYITNILDHLTNEDKEYIKTSPHYYLKFNKVESESNEIMIYITLYNISYAKFVFNFYKRPEYNISIPIENKFDNEFEQGSMLNRYIDITLLQLCNFLFYNEEKEQFDLEHLQLDEDSNLLKFYNKYKRPFDILDYNIRKDWSEILKNLCSINISVKYSKDCRGRIEHEEDSCKNLFEPSISNVVTLMTKICSSENNNIEEQYTKLFGRKLEADNVNYLLKSFFKLLVKNSANLDCESKGIEIKGENSIYGDINLTTMTNDEKDSTKQLIFTFTTEYTNFCYNSNENFQFLDYLKIISFKVKDGKEFNALEFILVSYADELKKKLFDRNIFTNSDKHYVSGSKFRW